MQARALKRYIRTSPRKMRLLIDLIRGKKVEEAINILRFSKQMASKTAEMTVRSAISNLKNKAEENEFLIDESDILIKEAFVDAGPMMKRIRPAPQGRAYRVRKRSNHLTIIVEAQNADDDHHEVSKSKKKATGNSPKANKALNNDASKDKSAKSRKKSDNGIKDDNYEKNNQE